MYVSVLQGRVTRQDDTPVSLPTASRVKLTVTHTYPLPTTTTTSTTTTTTTARPPPVAGEAAPLEGGMPPLVDEPFIIPDRRWNWQPTTKDEKLEPVFLDVDADGIFKYEMEIPDNVKRVSVEVKKNLVYCVTCER